MPRNPYIIIRIKMLFKIMYDTVITDMQMAVSYCFLNKNVRSVKM